MRGGDVPRRVAHDAALSGCPSRPDRPDRCQSGGAAAVADDPGMRDRRPPHEDRQRPAPSPPRALGREFTGGLQLPWANVTAPGTLISTGCGRPPPNAVLVSARVGSRGTARHRSVCRVGAVAWTSNQLVSAPSAIYPCHRWRCIGHKGRRSCRAAPRERSAPGKCRGTSWGRIRRSC